MKKPASQWRSEQAKEDIGLLDTMQASSYTSVTPSFILRQRIEKLFAAGAAGGKRVSADEELITPHPIHIFQNDQITLAAPGKMSFPELCFKFGERSPLPDLFGSDMYDDVVV